MAYTRGTATAAQQARLAADRERAEVERLYAEGRALAQTVKQLRTRNANLEARIRDETEALQDKRATLAQKLADLEAAQVEADAAIKLAEERASLIRELAFDQARAIAERAYSHGYRKGKDEARARHAVMARYAPRRPAKPKVVDLTPGELTAEPLRGREGLEAARQEYFAHTHREQVAA